MSFIPSVSTAVRFAGAGFLGQIGLGITNAAQRAKYQDFSNLMAASIVALSILGATPLGITSSAAFAGLGIARLIGKIDYKGKKCEMLYLASSITNLGGGVYALITLPFSYFNAAATVSLAISFVVGIVITIEK